MSIPLPTPCAYTYFIWNEQKRTCVSLQSIHLSLFSMQYVRLCVCVCVPSSYFDIYIIAITIRYSNSNMKTTKKLGYTLHTKTSNWFAFICSNVFKFCLPIKLECTHIMLQEHAQFKLKCTVRIHREEDERHNVDGLVDLLERNARTNTHTHTNTNTPQQQPRKKKPLTIPFLTQNFSLSFSLPLHKIYLFIHSQKIYKIP